MQDVLEDAGRGIGGGDGGEVEVLRVERKSRGLPIGSPLLFVVG